MPRGGSTPELVTIYWRDIPAQINAQLGRERSQVVLPAKFQRAIDRAKRKAKIVTAHEDVAQWRRVSRPCGPDLGAEAAGEAAIVEAAYSIERLGHLAYRGGFEVVEDDDFEEPTEADLAAFEELTDEEQQAQDEELARQALMNPQSTDSSHTGTPS